VAHRAAAEAGALAARGHRVTVLAPGVQRAAIEEGRALLRAAGDGDPEALLAPPGSVREVIVGRARPAGPGRRVGGPFDLAAGLESALAHTPFDVVHLHEPLAPSPALAALRHAGAVTAATFHRAEPLTGVAFLRPLVDRALARADIRIATTTVGRRALEEILPGEYLVIPGGVDLAALPAGAPEAEPPGLVLVARSRERAGLRFALGVLRALPPGTLGPVTVLGPPDAPWRTRAAVPKALREAVRVVPDGGPAVRLEALRAGSIALLATPEDASEPVLREALASGCAVVAPRCAAIEELARHGKEALILPPFSRDAWARAVAELAGDRARREALGRAAAGRGRSRGWDDVGRELEEAYAAALAAGAAAARPGPARVLADLRVRPEPSCPPAAIVAACAGRGIGVVAVASPEGIAPALAVAAAAPPELAVVVGQEVATTEGALVGLFLRADIPDGLTPAAAAAAVHAQGGLVVVPHPEGADVPPAQTIRELGPAIDCHEVLCAAADGPAAEEAARLALRLGMLGTAGSGATRPAQVGTVAMELPPFKDAAGLLEALADARLARPSRRRRGRDAGARRRGRRPPES
jgi:glycosyltransferase involved in cell wall biosynthesis/predicted metal-dependent phosphoesterase TrpH